jgi:hypothetical protein
MWRFNKGDYPKRTNICVQKGRPLMGEDLVWPGMMFAGPSNFMDERLSQNT